MGQFTSCLNIRKSVDVRVDHNCERAVDENLDEVVEVLADVIQPFLDFLQRRKVLSSAERQVVDKKTTNEEKLLVLLSLVKRKDNFKNSLITYLKANNFNVLASKLVPFPFPPEIVVSPALTILEAFKVELANHYKSDYWTRVPTVYGHSKPISKVWVPLQIEENTEFPKIYREENGFDHVELLKRLGNPQNPNFALVKGHPGVGKTTLVKKIAYEWANGHADNYFLILAVPLRHVDSTGDFLQLATDYYACRFRMSPAHKIELFDELMRLGRRLLICFDGLDEYSELAQSPFKKLFGSQFENSEPTCSSPLPPTVSCQLLITSRPYACDRINQDFFPLRFEILPLDAAHLEEFVRLYCETKQGVVKVIKYITVNANLVIKVPLILTFVCVLAETNEKIPTKLTLLYEKLLSLMIRRETEGIRRAEKISFDNWRNSSSLISTFKLAFKGCKEKKFEFPEARQIALGVNKDSFTYGFLLQKFDFNEGRLTAEFPHRSIQEFFAAVHSYQLIFTGDKTDRNSIMKEIFKKDSQFGRFFFGICSDKKKFDEMLEWLQPTFDDAEMIDFNFGHFLFLLSASLPDCSEAEAKRFGQRLTDSLDQLEDKMKTDRNRIINLDREDLSSMNRAFQSGLNLHFYDEKGLTTGNFTDNWSLSRIDKPKWSRLTYVNGHPPVSLRGTQVFMWTWKSSDLAEKISFLDQLPSVSTLIVQTYKVDFEVNFDLNYDIIATMASSLPNAPLRHFTFGFGKANISFLNDFFSGQPQNDNFTIRETRKTWWPAEISWLTVTIRQQLDQSQLLRILIGLAVRCAVETIS